MLDGFEGKLTLSKWVVFCNGRFDGYGDFCSSELLRLSLNEKNITNARQVVGHYDEVKRIKDSMRARNEAREFDAREKN
ncbi:MAG: hypothetical protein A4S09_16245 [Proteobacteria bacterium SG_bin7]|nr:MAG: hypothetical protein A4S09_16245 [Proteobacteria bacterium SG_bin7]